MAGIDINTILNALPEDKKVKGLQKLGQILIQKGTELENQIPSSITSLVSQFTPGSCPDSVILQSIVEKRNNIVGKLNTVGQSLNVITSTYTGVSSFLDVVLFSISNLKNIKIGVSAAAKAIPFGLPGAIPASLSDLAAAANSLDNLIKNIQFDDLGNPKLTAQLGNFNAGFATLSYLDTVIQSLILKLNSIDTVLLRCGATLAPLDSALQQVAENSSDILYKGFILRVEEIKFNDTLTQKQGVAYNKSGIALLKTDASFTSDIQTLINTLKFIIDKDNLKAN